MKAVAKRNESVGSGEIIDPEVDGWAFKPPLCVFCNAPWTDDMIKVSAEAEMEHGYYGDSWVDHIDAKVDIVCSSCSRLVYRKELRRVGRHD